MKNYLLAVGILKKAMLLPLLVFITNTLMYAQQVYASGQSTQVYGLCLSCSVQNPENVVGSDEGNYVSLQMPLGVAATIEQRLSFSSAKTYSKVVIGIGTNQPGLSLQLLGGASVETFNGNVSNNDFRIINNDILKIGTTDPSKGTIEFSTNKPYDRVVLRFHSVLGLNQELRVYYAYQLNGTYASSETHRDNYNNCHCSIQNPQNAVGPNEIDFSKLIQNPHEGFYTGEQSLYFPSIKTSTKLVIGVSSDSKLINQIIDKEVDIETRNGGYFSEIISNRLKIDPQNSYKGTIELITSTSYNNIYFNMKVNHYSTNDLQIHYAYQEDIYDPQLATSAHAMKTAPAEKTLTVYPNPTRGQVTLQGNIDFTDADIFISNTFGKEVFRSKFRSKTIDLPAALPGGVYMLSVQTKEGQVYTQKVILTR